MGSMDLYMGLIENNNFKHSSPGDNFDNRDVGAGALAVPRQPLQVCSRRCFCGADADVPWGYRAHVFLAITA